MRTKLNTIKMFATANPTEKWVVAIDGFFCFSESEIQANALYEEAMKGSNGNIDNTSFGSIEIIKPNHEPKYINGYMPEGGIVDVRTRRPIDLKNYIAKHKNRRYLPSDKLASNSTPADRLEWAKFMSSVIRVESWKSVIRNQP